MVGDGLGPAFVVHTVRAGDAFAVALAMGLLSRVSLGEVHVVATEIARFVCSQPGATPSLPAVYRKQFN